MPVRLAAARGGETRLAAAQENEDSDDDFYGAKETPAVEEMHKAELASINAEIARLEAKTSSLKQELEKVQRIQSAAVLVLVCSFFTFLSSSWMEDLVLNIVMACATYYIGSNTNFQKEPYCGCVTGNSWYFWATLVGAVLGAIRDIKAFAEGEPHKSALVGLVELFRVVMRVYHG
jgi:hypothetical protein